MKLRRFTILPAILLLNLAGAACSDDDPGAEPSQATSNKPSDVVDGSGIELSCTGDGDSTIILESGLGESADMWSDFVPQLEAEYRVCTSSRAGLGASPPLPVSDPDPSPGVAAEQLYMALADEGEAAPYVVLGFSYGGMVAQAFAATYRQDVAGLVLDDSADPGQFTDAPWLDQGITWAEGGREIDQEAATEQLAALDFRDLPVFVLTQDQLPRELDELWVSYHERVAGLTTQSVHVRARGAGHAIHEDRPGLVVAAVNEVVAAAGGAPLSPCNERFDADGGECL